ncbi:protein-glutamine gamma-glutamyltransferase 2-like [Antennarius striatus]|uniref:protein-glutamine gamma-glutamyltransferase 2-like n=1 Tax=Antennarius striatus TaxID=241820 RepID=UPI0035B18399
MSQVLDIDHCDLDIKSNSSSHHTDLFGEKRLIVRRGQPFNIIIHLKADNRNFHPDEKSFTLTVETGPLPRKESDTKATFGLSESTAETEWSASATSDPSGNTVSVSISSSPNAPIGLYSLSLDQVGQTTVLGEFFLLFNAWCPRDAVYMSSKKKRHEYVLEQHGQIFRGTHKRIKGTPWNFAQFDPRILDICLMILDANPKFVSDADKDCSARRNPIYVSRVLSAMINSNDDRGVLVGEWEEYSGGVHPGMWIGSADILQQWAENGPVRYGQCWVFAAVACTVSRALGIPCRVVTNFGSAHDSDANLKIENLYNEDGDRISEGDSVCVDHTILLSEATGELCLFVRRMRRPLWRYGLAKPDCEFGPERRISMRLEYDRYGSAITSDRLIHLSAITIDKQTIDYQKAEKTVVLDEPDIEIKLVGEATVNQSVTVDLTLLNPLPEALQDCSFTIEGAGLTDGKPITVKLGAVDAKQEAKASIEFRPTSVCSSVLLVNFDSNKLKNIKSFINITVNQ